MSRIYLTHCSAKKDPALKDTGILVTPNVLYTATPTKRFITRCKRCGVTWAIFSDLYGVWFPNETHRWYEKHPNSVTTSEFQDLCSNFESRLAGFSEVWFYHNPGRFHPLYRKLLTTVSLPGNIRLFTHLNQIC